MKLRHGAHLAYCTNIHRGESWRETLSALEKHTLAVRERVCPGKLYAIGLRLSDLASRELSDKTVLLEFQRWLDRHQCYVFTVNGFPYGKFHGTRVKEQVYAPDWTTPERVEYTNRLFDLLAEIVPHGLEGSVSTVPGSFKEFIRSPEQERAMRDHLWRCVEHIADLARRSGKALHLGLEPEPLCYLETSGETVAFIEQLRADRPRDLRLSEHLGVNYDCCHLGVEFENPGEALGRFRHHGVRVSKIHLSNALSVVPREPVRRYLQRFADDVYLHQVIERRSDGRLARYRDLDQALAQVLPGDGEDREWRIHFHIPLHSPPHEFFTNTGDHLAGVLDDLRDHRGCTHLEMETYTWEVLPPEFKKRNVADQLVAEYDWTLRQLAERGFTAE
jgi:hypothetical protein